MAKLSAHGSEIGRIESLVSTTAYMSDGKVLINHGFGWKLYKTVKAGLDPRVVYQNAVARVKAKNEGRIHYRNYKKALHSMAGLSKRWKLHAAVEIMPDDPDGVWSEVCDGYGDNVSASIEEVAELCKLYKLAISEIREEA